MLVERHLPNMTCLASLQECVEESGREFEVRVGGDTWSEVVSEASAYCEAQRRKAEEDLLTQEDAKTEKGGGKRYSCPSCLQYFAVRDLTVHHAD